MATHEEPPLKEDPGKTYPCPNCGKISRKEGYCDECRAGGKRIN